MVFDEAGEDALLLAAMKQLGAVGGSLGGGVAGALTGAPGSARAVSRGGSRGAAWGVRWTKKNVATAHVPLALAMAEASRHLCQALASAGTVIATETRDDGGFAARAVIGVGLGGLNPAVVTAVVTPAPDGAGTTVALRAAGREGLIKQHPADKGLAKVTALLNTPAG